MELGPFTIGESIGRGGMAEVFAGTHVHQNTPVAIKVITAAYARNPLFLTSFKNEVHAVARLHHPGIVMVFDHGVVGADAARAGIIEADSPYLVMEHASYGALDRVRRTMSWKALKKLLRSLLDALAHAHARGVLHRDLKPANILVSGPNDLRPGVKLTDFGIAHALEREELPTAPEIMGGTPLYMAPEQFEAAWRDYGPWTDLYAVGCIAYLYATGRPPFVGDNPKSLGVEHLTSPVPPMASDQPMPDAFEGWVRRMLAKDPRDRYRCAADAAWALESLDHGEAYEEEADTNLRRMMNALPPTTTFFELATEPTTPRRGPIVRATVEIPPQPRPAVRLPPFPGTWRRPTPPGPRGHLMGAGLGLFGLRTIPMVDREAERDLLWSQLATVRREGGSRAVWLVGPAGTGKTRLVEWITQRATEVGGAIVLRAYFGPNESPSEGLPRMLARHLRANGLLRDAVEERCSRVLGQLGVDDPFEARVLTEMVAPRRLDNLESRLSARTIDGREQHAVALRYVERLAEERPVIVWLDDAQWSSDAIKFAQFVLDSQTSRAILVLLTTREEQLVERPIESAMLKELVGGPRAQRLVVGPLAEEDHQLLVQELLGLNRHAAHLVAQRTSGNPLFAVQLVGDWVQRGVLTLGDSGFSLTAGESTALPDGIHEVWAARVELILERHPTTARIALEIAAILGNEVDQIEWEAACERARIEAPRELVDDLAERRLVQPTELGFMFAHSMLRETVERLAREAGRFSSHHRDAAQMLADRYGWLTRGMAERIGRHFLAGGLYAEALDPLRRGIDERIGSSTYLDALALIRDYERALTILNKAEDDVAWSAGWILRARVAKLQGDFDEATTWAEKATAAAARSGHEHTVADATQELAHVAYHAGRPRRAIDLFETARRLFTKLRDGVGVAQSLIGLADVHYLIGDLDGAEVRYEEALQLSGPKSGRIETADALWGLGYVAMWRGRYDAATDAFMRQRAIAERMGHRHGLARCTAGMAEVARLRGEFEAADDLYAKAIEINEAIGSNEAMLGYYNRALALLARGRIDDAKAMARDMRFDERFGDVHAAQMHSIRLPLDAVEANWTEFDRRLEELVRLLGETEAVDGDVAWSLDLAARFADHAGENDRAAAARTLSGPMWKKLGRSHSAQD